MVRTPCCDKSGLKKGTWTAEEDKKLIAYVTMYGHRNWRQLPKFAGLARCGKSCRLRWMNYLRPGIKRGNYTREEEDTIIKLHARLGNRWSMIASHLQGRSDNEIKNHWHSHLKKRVQQCSVTNQKAEACKSKYESPAESFQEKNSVEVVGTFQNSSLPTNFHTPHVHVHASPSSHHTSSTDFLCTMTEPAPASNGNSVVDDIANFLEKSADLICAYSWKELYDISYFSGEFLVPFVTEPQSFCPIYDVWGLSEY